MKEDDSDSAPVTPNAVLEPLLANFKDPRRLNRIAAFYDFTQGGIEAKPYDDYGHGTHVAGLIGGSGDVMNLSLGHPIYQKAEDDPLVQRSRSRRSTPSPARR